MANSGCSILQIHVQISRELGLLVPTLLWDKNCSHDFIWDAEVITKKSIYYTWTVTCSMASQAIPDILVAWKTLVSTPQSPEEGRQGKVLMFSFCASNSLWHQNLTDSSNYHHCFSNLQGFQSVIGLWETAWGLPGDCSNTSRKEVFIPLGWAGQCRRKGCEHPLSSLSSRQRKGSLTCPSFTVLGTALFQGLCM